MPHQVFLVGSRKQVEEVMEFVGSQHATVRHLGGLDNLTALLIGSDDRLRSSRLKASSMSRTTLTLLLRHRLLAQPHGFEGLLDRRERPGPRDLPGLDFEHLRQ